MRKLKTMKQFGSFVVACALVASPVAGYIKPQTVSAAESLVNSMQADTPVIDSIQLNGNQSVILNDLSMYPDGKNNRITFTLTLINNSYSDMDFINYWVRLQSSTGLNYSVNLLAEDKDKNRITAQSSKL